MVIRISVFWLGIMSVICVSCSTLQPQSTQSVTLSPALVTLPPYTDTPISSPTPSVVCPSTSTPTLNPALVKVLTTTPDFQKAVNRTPISPEKCPEINTSIVPELPKDYTEMPPHFSYSNAILEYLNAGGSPKVLQNYLSLDSRHWAKKDLTGDGAPEIMVSFIGHNIFMCEAGQYTNILNLPLEGDPMASTLLAIQDMNLDGIPELAFQDEIFSAGVRMYKIYEWDGKEFQSLIWPESELYAWFSTPKGQGLKWYDYSALNNLSPFNEIEGIAGNATIKDIDGNGTKEFVVQNQVLPVRHRGYSPWRATTDIYKWNGVIFLWDQVDIEPPAYRFQAIQDADRMFLLGNNQEALKLYQAVISENTLYAWSLENYKQQLDAEGEGSSTPTLIPVIQDEYDNLAAYAQYRIMLLQVLQGDLVSAQNTYETLQKKFPDGTQGYHFTQMATNFWQEYQSSRNLGEACLKVINYAEQHQNDIFAYLGNTEQDITHGTQSHFYTPWDLCPFE